MKARTEKRELYSVNAGSVFSRTSTESPDYTAIMPDIIKVISETLNGRSSRPGT